MPKINKSSVSKLKSMKKEAATQLSRRDFLKLSVPVTGLLVLGARPSLVAASSQASPAPSPDSVAMLYDSSKCLGCRRCEDACRRWNKLAPEYRPIDLSARSLTMLKYRQVVEKGKAKWLPSKWQCMHCVQPSCANVCPTQALHKTEDGPVLYDESRCIGCQYCVSACPFSVPRFDWEKNRMIKKCTFCTDRVADGLQPACSGVCPAKALTFGKRQEIMDRANEAQAKGAYVFGKKEAGGTSWIYISDVPFEERGVPLVAAESYPLHSQATLVPQIGAIAVGAAALGVYSLYLRRKKIEGRQDE